MMFCLVGISKRHCQHQRLTLAEAAMPEVEEARTNEVEIKEEGANNVVVHNNEDEVEVGLPEPAILLAIWGEEADLVGGPLLRRTRLFGFISCSTSRRRLYYLRASSSSPKSGARRMQMHLAIRTSARPLRRARYI